MLLIMYVLFLAARDSSRSEPLKGVTIDERPEICNA